MSKAKGATDVVREIADCWRRRDLDGVINHLSEDAEYQLPGGRIWRGRDAVREGLQIAMQQPFDPLTDDIAERVITSDVSVVTQTRSFGPQRLSNGRTMPPSRSFATIVLRRTGDRWMVVAAHTSMAIQT
jgi:uncharacterized protein (TIGR02246 family)